MSSLVVASLFITSSFLSCSKDDNPGNSGGNSGSYSGYIYTSTNSSEGNGIVMFGRKTDGSVTELPNSPLPTGALGDALDGDFDTQYALQIVGDYLLAVNAGDNPVNSSVSVLKINRTDGSLTQVDHNP